MSYCRASSWSAFPLALGLVVLPSSSPPERGAGEVFPLRVRLRPFGDIRVKVGVKVFLVAILYIVFDLEVVFLYPWAVSLGETREYGLLVMLVYLFYLSAGLLFELVNRALDWRD